MTKENTSQEETNTKEAENAEVKDQAPTPSEETLQPKEVNTDWKDKYVRLHAEFDNFRKRTSRERIELVKNANGDLIGDLLSVLDDFDRAIKHNTGNNDPEALKEGFNLINQKMSKMLEGKGLQPMNSMGEVFDTDLHEALTQIPAASDDQKGKVVDVIEKGYYLNGNVLRYAKVVVGN